MDVSSVGSPAAESVGNMRGPFDPNLSVPTPGFAWLEFTANLGAAGSATDQIVYDLSNMTGVFFTRTPGVLAAEIFVRLGEDAPLMPVMSGMFYRTSGIRRVKFVNLSANARAVTAVFSSDPNFEVTGSGRILG